MQNFVNSLYREDLVDVECFFFPSFIGPQFMVSNPAGQVYHRFGAGKSVRERVSPQLHPLIF